ncbi:MAG: hypothetical protein Q4A98_09570 [Comamonadaceae bacterium]|nr:hypothetical protein [Comamonadaceae bacterium]
MQTFMPGTNTCSSSIQRTPAMMMDRHQQAPLSNEPLAKDNPGFFRLARIVAP